MADHELLVSEDGSHTLSSRRYGVTYHSKFGAINESITVFLSAGFQYQVLRGKKELSIFEMGLGTGLNALLTMMEADRLGIDVHYTAIEKHPLDMPMVRELNYIDKLANISYRHPFHLIHEQPADDFSSLSPCFTFKKIIDDISIVPLQESYDVIYYDAFAPDAQEELWSTLIMKKLYSILKDGGVLVTYCAKGSFRRSLKEAGFTVEVLPGPPGKREMTRAIRFLDKR